MKVVDIDHNRSLSRKYVERYAQRIDRSRKFFGEGPLNYNEELSPRLEMLPDEIYAKHSPRTVAHLSHMLWILGLKELSIGIAGKVIESHAHKNIEIAQQAYQSLPSFEDSEQKAIREAVYGGSLGDDSRLDCILGWEGPSKVSLPFYGSLKTIIKPRRIQSKQLRRCYEDYLMLRDSN